MVVRLSHVHALDAAGERLLVTSVRKLGAVLFILDATNDGEIDYLDVFEMANPNPFQPLFRSRSSECVEGDPYCA